MVDHVPDEEVSIFDKILERAIGGAQARFGDVQISEEKARKLIFYLLESKQRDDERTFTEQKSAKLTEMKVFGRERSALHSVATRYFKALKGRYNKAVIESEVTAYEPPSPVQTLESEKMWVSIGEQCRAEFSKRCRDTNEHILTVDGDTVEHEIEE